MNPGEVLMQLLATPTVLHDTCVHLDPVFAKHVVAFHTQCGPCRIHVRILFLTPPPGMEQKLVKEEVIGLVLWT